MVSFIPSHVVVTQTDRAGRAACATQRRRRVCSAAVRDTREKQSDDFSLEKLGFLEVGLIIGPHGVRGGAKVRSLSDFPQQRLCEENSKRYLKAPTRLYPRPVTIKRGQKAAQKDVWIVWLDGVHTPDEVNELKGSRICVKASDKPKMKRGEYYVRDLVGLKVRLYGSGAEIGIVNDVYTFEEMTRHIRNPARFGHDLLEVMIDGDAENLVLVPFVKQIVPVVDMDGAEILMDPPEGLFDAAKVNLIVKRSAPRLFLKAAGDSGEPTDTDEGTRDNGD